jgi:hypothetical protein
VITRSPLKVNTVKLRKNSASFLAGKQFINHEGSKARKNKNSIKSFSRCLRLLLVDILQNHSLNAILDKGNMKVDQKAKSFMK